MNVSRTATLVTRRRSVRAGVLSARYGAKPAIVASGIGVTVILPFLSVVDAIDPSQEYLSDGVTEELSERLGPFSPAESATLSCC